MSERWLAMNKKSNSEIAYRNLTFLIISIFATIYFMMEVTSALHTIKYNGMLGNVQYTIFQLKITVTNDLDGSNYLYNIFNYPLIPISAGLIYNIYIMIKGFRNRNIINSKQL